MGKDLILIVISGAGVVLWYFVITLIQDLKESNKENLKTLIEIEKTVVEIRVNQSNLEKENTSLWNEIEHAEKEIASLRNEIEDIKRSIK